MPRTVAGRARLGQPEAADRLAGGHPRQPLLLLLGGPPGGTEDVVAGNTCAGVVTCQDNNGSGDAVLAADAEVRFDDAPVVDQRGPGGRGVSMTASPCFCTR